MSAVGCPPMRCARLATGWTAFESPSTSAGAGSEASRATGWTPCWEIGACLTPTLFNAGSTLCANSALKSDVTSCTWCTLKVAVRAQCRCYSPMGGPDHSWSTCRFLRRFLTRVRRALTPPTRSRSSFRHCPGTGSADRRPGRCTWAADTARGRLRARRPGLDRGGGRLHARARHQAGHARSGPVRQSRGTGSVDWREDRRVEQHSPR